MTKSKYDCSHVIEVDEEPRHHLVIANEFVRAFAVEIAPHDRTLCHHHPNDYLLYIASDAEIVSAARGEDPKQLNYRDGECELSSAGLMHVVENLGDNPFRNIVVELLPRAGELRRGLQPSVTDGDAQIGQILEERPGAILSVAMQPGSAIGISGPAVLASPYDDKLMVKELDEFDIPLGEFKKLMWVCAPRKVVVRNSGQARAHLVVFQVGPDTTR